MSAPSLFRAATMPGDPHKPNEDLAGVLGGSAVLLDGSGAPGDLPTGCIHGVPWFVRQLGSHCLAAMAVSGDEPLPRILATAITDVAALHADTCDLSCPGTPSCVLAMTRASASTFDYLVLGDVTLVIEYDDAWIDAITDDRMDRVAQDEYRAMLALPTGTPEHQAARIRFVTRQQPLRNQPGGYPVASTIPESAAEALTGSHPAASIRRTALLSDGVTRFTEFGLGTWHDLLAILASDGPAELFARIRHAEDSDPDGQRWPRAKRHDDVGVVFSDGIAG